MPYLGNEPAEAYSNIAYQDFGTQSGTTFTLDFPAGAPGELEVFVNNVRQEPSVAYTVSGTTLTMTGTVAATDDFYVVFQGKAQQTVTHPANTALVASSGTFSSTLAVTGASTFSGATTITTADNSTQLTLKSTDADAAAGPRFDLIRDSASPADGDNIGRIRYMFDNDAAERTEGVRLDGVLVDVTDGTEDVSYAVSTMQAGTLTESMRVDHAGGVRINTTAQLFNNIGNEKLTVDGKTTGQAASFSTSTSGGFPAIYVRNTVSGTVNAIIFEQGLPSAAVGSITMAGGSSTAYNTSSDYRLKTEVTYDWDATTRLKQLKPARFKWIVAGDDAVFVDGFLAHEAQAVVPEAVTGTKDEVDADGNAVMQGIDQSKLVPLLVKTIQELEARIAALEAN